MWANINAIYVMAMVVLWYSTGAQRPRRRRRRRVAD